MRLARLPLLLALVALVALPAGARAGSPPAGATAQCRDGTYSYSQHRSGTCSHHGGVARWLDGATASPAAASSTSVGATVLLAPHTRSAGCVLGPSPDRRCSPGAYSSKLTRATLCSSSFRTSSIRNVPEAEKFAVEREYGMAPSHYGSALEIDHIVSLELGGSNDIANLYPERAPGYHAKDKLENRLHAMVCSGQIALHNAQQRIAVNWQALFASVFGTAPGV